MTETTQKLESLVKEMEARHGKTKTKEILKSMIDKLAPPIPNSTLTIISDRGVHHLPDAYKRGELYYVTEPLDFKKLPSVENKYKEVLLKLATKLKSNQWKTIYLVPFGHNTLCMQIKLLVFRITRLETIDLFYNDGSYTDLYIYQRDIILNKKSSPE